MNEIGAQGAEHLATALQQNKVTFLSHTTLHTTNHSSISQTLETLNLASNQIGAQGAEYIANGLQENEVTFFTSFDFPYNYSLTIFTDTQNTEPYMESNW